MNLTKDDFKPQTEEEKGMRDEIPAGTYTAVISAEQTKATKRGDGEYLELTLTIQGGRHDGRKLFDRINLRNPSSKAVAIARETLQSICAAIGGKPPSDTAKLVGSRLQVTTFLEEFNGKQYARIKGYSQAQAQAAAEPSGSDLDDLPF